MYCNGRFIRIFLIFILINMGTNVICDIKIKNSITQQQIWQAPNTNDPKKLSKPELLQERKKLLKKQLIIINSHLYDTLKERLNLIQKDLKKVSKDLNVDHPSNNVNEYLASNALRKRSSVKDNLSEEYKKSMDKIDNQITMEGDNQNFMADRGERSFLLSGYNEIASVPKLLSDFNNNLNENKLFQTKCLAKKNVNSIQPITINGNHIESNRTLIPFPTNQKLYDFSKRNTIKEGLLEEYCKQMDIMAHTLMTLNKRNNHAHDTNRREIYSESNPLERNKWITSKGEYHKNDFDEGIWKMTPSPFPVPVPLHETARIAKHNKHNIQRRHPLYLKKWLTKKNLNQYYSSDLDENTRKTTPRIFDLRKRKNCRNVDTFLHYHPLKVHEWLSTKGGEYYKSNFDQDIWKIQPITPTPVLLPTSCAINSNLNANSNPYTNSNLHSNFNFGSDSVRRRYTPYNKNPAEMNKLLTKGGEYYKTDIDNNLWNLPFPPPTPIPSPNKYISYRNSDIFSDIESTKAKNAICRSPTTNVTPLYPNVLTKAVEISLNPTNQAHKSGSLLENVAKRMNTSTLDLAEKIADSSDVSNLSVMSNAALNRITDTYSKTVITPKPINVNNNQPNMLHIVPSVQTVTLAPKSFNGSVENYNNNNNSNDSYANSNPDYIVMPNDSNVNIATILDQVLAKLESMQRDKICEDDDENSRPEGVPCDIVGVWSSQTLGFCLNIETNAQKYRDNTYEYRYHTLKVEPQECTPPKVHNMLGVDWSFGGATQKQIGGPFYMYAYKQNERSLATFTGFCRTCFRTDTVFGSWTLVTPNKDCSDICLAFNNKQDVLKRIQMESKRKERFKNLVLQQQLQQQQKQH